MQRQNPRIRYEADGKETTFTYPFTISKEQDLKVWIDSNEQKGGFKIKGIQATTGGEVIFDTPPEQGSIITLLRKDTYHKEK